jgi:hypothetical protein
VMPHSIVALVDLTDSDGDHLAPYPREGRGDLDQRPIE